jgi:hypothetical protein
LNRQILTNAREQSQIDKMAFSDLGEVSELNITLGQSEMDHVTCQLGRCCYACSKAFPCVARREVARLGLDLPAPAAMFGREIYEARMLVHRRTCAALFKAFYSVLYLSMVYKDRGNLTSETGGWEWGEGPSLTH